MELTVFISETVEMNGFAFHNRNEFLREGFTHSETSGGTVGIRHMGGDWVGGIALSGSEHREHTGTDDDVAQINVSSDIGYTHVTGKRYSLTATVGGYRYTPYAASDGAAVHSRFWSLRPRFRWSVSLPVSLWAEASVEASSSDESNAEYDGYGVSVGLDYSPSNPLSVALSLHHGAYKLSNSNGDRNDAFYATLTLSYRHATWVELYGNASGGTFWQQDSGLNYDRSQIGIGFRFAYDLEVGSSAF
jgi:hypothetical protein